MKSVYAIAARPPSLYKDTINRRVFERAPDGTRVFEAVQRPERGSTEWTLCCLLLCVETERCRAREI